MAAAFLRFEQMMEKPIFNAGLNFLLAIVIFYNAELGRLMGITEGPLAISVVWPATGFSLASILLFGFKTWPGIFLGNFFYNHLQIANDSLNFWTPILLGGTIALGSLIQACVSGAIMRRYSSTGYFNTIKDIFIFLIPAGILACLIAPTIGMLALTLYGAFSEWRIILHTWFTFWVGDMMGVYIFTSLIVVWSLYKPAVKLKEYPWEALFMAASFLILSYLMFIQKYHVTHLFIPLALWITFRFRMHGATLAIFFITLTAIILTSMGYGYFNKFYENDPLIVLISFLEVIVAACLILAAVINERQTAWDLLENQNLDLQQAVESHLEERYGEMFIKEKLTSLGILTSALVSQLRMPLKRINKFVKACRACIVQMEGAISPEKNISPTAGKLFESNFELLKYYLQNVEDFEAQAKRMVGVAQEQLALNTPERTKVRLINLNVLLNICLVQASQDATKKDPEFSFIVVKDLDKNISMVLALPEDFAHAIIHLINYNISSMKKKQKRLDEYSPILEATTKIQNGRVEIILKDNGDGVPEEELKTIFRSFLSSSLDPTEVGLSLAHDIIVQVYDGEVHASAVEGAYLSFRISIPIAKGAGFKKIDS